MPHEMGKTVTIKKDMVQSGVRNDKIRDKGSTFGKGKERHV